MRCCLILFCSVVMSSSRRIVLASMTPAIINTYGRTGEVSRVASSSRRPSSGKLACSAGGPSSRTSSDAADSFNGSAVEVLSAPATTEDATGLGDVLHEQVATHLLRRPLSRFFFLLPEVV